MRLISLTLSWLGQIVSPHRGAQPQSKGAIPVCCVAAPHHNLRARSGIYRGFVWFESCARTSSIDDDAMTTKLESPVVVARRTFLCRAIIVYAFMFVWIGKAAIQCDLLINKYGIYREPADCLPATAYPYRDGGCAQCAHKVYVCVCVDGVSFKVSARGDQHNPLGAKWWEWVCGVCVCLCV